MLTPKNAGKLVTQEDIGKELKERLDLVFKTEEQAVRMVGHVIDIVRKHLLCSNAISLNDLGTLLVVPGKETGRKIPGGETWRGTIRPRMTVRLRDRFIEEFKQRKG